MAKKPVGGPKKKNTDLGTPRSDRDRKFCERYLVHFDKDRAYREAGFATKGQGTASRESAAKLAKFADYLRPFKDAKARILAERLAIDSETVLKAMAQKVFFDPSGFYERTNKPLTEWTKPRGKKEPVEQVQTWNGEPIYGERLKPYSDLTPEQRAIVQITSDTGGVIRYRLPTIVEQHQYLTSLGRQFGMFAEKLIVERHNHKHVHHSLTFENVPTQKLVNLERQLLPLVEPEFARRLGYTPDEIEQAAAEEGVLMPAKESA